MSLPSSPKYFSHSINNEKKIIKNSLKMIVNITKSKIFFSNIIYFKFKVRCYLFQLILGNKSDHNLYKCHKSFPCSAKLMSLTCLCSSQIETRFEFVKIIIIIKE